MSNILGGHPDEVPLTNEERAAINTLRRLAKRWPKSLWLFSASGTLQVHRNMADGKRAGCTRDHEGVDPDYEVATIYGIENDGGDY